MQSLPDGFSLVMLTPIKNSDRDRVARKAPLCAHANLFAGCRAQLINAPLHTFPKNKEGTLQTFRVRDCKGYALQLEQRRAGFREDLYCSPGTCCQDQRELQIQLPVQSFKTLCWQYKVSRGDKKLLKAGERKKCRGIKFKWRNGPQSNGPGRNGPQEPCRES